MPLDKSEVPDNQNHMIGFVYDAAGNLTQEGSGSPSWTYTLDAENRLSSISGSASNNFTYDGDGERVKRSFGGLFWRQHGGPFLTKTNLSGSILSERIYFNGLHVAIAHPPSGPVNYAFQDALGGEHIITDATGNVCQDIDTLPFGSEIGFNTACNSSYRFAGMERDNEISSNLDYAIGRYYDNRLGRFLSPDEFTGGPVDAYSPNDPSPPGPLPYADISNPQSLNKYSYTYDNPVRYMDPNGHLVVLGGSAQDEAEEKRRLLQNASKKGEDALFKTVQDKKGRTKLVLDKKAAAKFKGPHSQGFNMLVQTINSQNTVTVMMDNLESRTTYQGKDATVILDRNVGNTDIIAPMRNAAGGIVPNPFNIIAGHEVLGHARLHLLGDPRAYDDGPGSETFRVENILRKEQGIELRPDTEW